MVAAAVAAAACLLCEPTVDAATAQTKLLLGPTAIGHGGRIELEHARQRGALPRLRVVGGRVFDETALVTLYTEFSHVLALRRPFTVLWDPRPVRFPHISGRQIKLIRAWVDANAVRWDTHVQAHAILLTNPIARSIAWMVIQLFAPPQPIRIVSSEAETLAFAEDCCPKPRSWVKSSYADRDQRFSVFGGRWGGGSPGRVT